MMRRMGTLLAAGLIAVMLAPPLRAQESQESRAQAPPAVKLKSEKKALTLSVVGTLVPLAVYGSYFLASYPSDSYANIASVGALLAPLGPSLGYFYTGATGRAFLGIGIRLAGLAGMIAGSYGLDEVDSNETLMTALFAVGACVSLASFVIDLAGVKKAVRRHNDKVQGLELALAAVVSPKTKAFGLQMRLSF